jgi:ribosome-associated translation inhibitor RaiA
MRSTHEFIEPVVPVRTASRGRVSSAEFDRAVERLLRVARSAPRTVRSLKVELAREPDPARERPCVAKASIDVDGRVVRGHVAAESMPVALELLERHLSRRMRDLADRARAERSEQGLPIPGEWRHGDLPTRRPETFPRPPSERLVVRRKTYAGGPETVEEAAWEMRLLDHEFLLFTNCASSEENVLYVGLDDVLHVKQPAPVGEAYVEPAIIDGDPAPVVTEDEAIALFDLADGRFLFFVDRGSGRGALLYHRYDGHYGIVTPA